jgi:lysophospholipase L1-like esterase
LVFVSFFLIFLSIFGCYFIAEKYFFDKFFYQKSVIHGYYPSLKPVDIRYFGGRSLGIRQLQNHNRLISDKDTSKYKILLIGDSFVWGVGILNNQRYANLLENKLNRIRPTKVISVSYPGWNTSEYLKYYNLSVNDFTPDLTIFSLVHNDSLLSRYNRDDDLYQKCQKMFPQTTPIISTDVNPLVSQNISANEINKLIEKQHDDSWTNEVNLCVLDSNLANLPSSKTIYFLTDDYEANNLYAIYNKNLQKYKKNVIGAFLGKKLPQYSSHWKTNNDPYLSLCVSKNESHPNSLANQMYADILYNEIISNPEYNFQK